MNRRSFFTKLAVGAAAAPQLAKVAAEAPKPTVLAPFSGCTGTWDFAYTKSLHVTDETLIQDLYPPFPYQK